MRSTEGPRVGVLAVLILMALCPAAPVVGQGPGREPPRREVSGEVIGADPFGLLIRTPDGMERIQVGPGLPDRLGFVEGLGRLIPGMGAPGAFPPGVGGLPFDPQRPRGPAGPEAGALPVELRIRVATTIDAIQVGDRLAYRATATGRSHRPDGVVRAIERFPAGAADPDLPDDDAIEEAEGEVTEGAEAEAGDDAATARGRAGAAREARAADGPKWYLVRVVSVRPGTLLVEHEGRRFELPVDRSTVVRFDSDDPRWVGLGDAVTAVGRQNPDGSIQATRLSIEHVDEGLAGGELAEDEFAARGRLAALADGERAAVPLPAAPPIAPPAAPPIAIGAVDTAESDEGTGIPASERRGESEAGVSPARPSDPLSPVPGPRAFGRRVKIN